MSRADGLQRLNVDECGVCPAPRGPLVRQADADKVIRDIESTIAARDARIAELETNVRQLKAALTERNQQAAFDAARAEVPEWCRDILVLLEKAARWKGYQARKKRSELVRELIAELSAEQRNACGMGAKL